MAWKPKWSVLCPINLPSRQMTVLYLERRSEGGLTLGSLERGKCRELTAEEIQNLESQAE